MVATSVGKIALIVTAFVPLAVSTGDVARIADAQTHLPDVRFVATPPEVVDAMLTAARVTSADIVYDLGSGDGRIVIAAAKKYGARGVGIEINPQLVAESNASARAAGVSHLVQFIQGDLFTADFSAATVVVLYHASSRTSTTCSAGRPTSGSTWTGGGCFSGPCRRRTRARDAHDDRVSAA